MNRAQQHKQHMTREPDLAGRVERRRREENGRPTAAQCGRLYAIGRAAGLANPGVKQLMFERYGAMSSSDLTLRQYEELCSYLLLVQKTREAEARAPGSSAEMSASRRMRSLKDCQQLLEVAWPDLIAEQHRWQLARDVALALDACRLTRSAGIWSEARARTTIERMKKLGYEVVAAAVAVYLERYTSRDERYLIGICRRLDREARMEERRVRGAGCQPAAGESAGRMPAPAHTPRTTPPPTGPRPELSDADRERFRQRRPGATR